MAFAAGQKIKLKMNDIQVGIGEVVFGSTNWYLPCSSQGFVKAQRLTSGLNQRAMYYAHIGDCIGDSVGSPIPWAIERT